MFATLAPLQQYFDSDGSPLDSGYLYFGLPNQNPETAPTLIYWDEAGTQPAAQPIRTLNGYAVRNGSPAAIFAAGDYSVSIKSRAGVLLVYAASSASFITQLINNTDATKGAALIGYKPPFASSVGRTVSSKLSEYVSVKDFGATGDGSTIDSTAFTNAFAAASTIHVPPGTYRFASNYTVPNGKRLVIDDGAQLSVDATFTLTINGLVEAGVGQIFGGSGTVLGVRRVRPEWFGATRTGAAHNDAPAFQKAQNCMEAGLTSDGGEMCMLLLGGAYGLASQVVCTPNTASCIQWEGQGSSAGTYIVGMAAWTGANGVLKLAANAVNSVGSACRFSGFRVVPETAGTGSTTGILIGNDAALVLQGGAHESGLFEDVGVYDFAVCWQITHTRSFCFRRCSAWVQTVVSGKCLVISSTVSGLFTGDLDFYNFQATANATTAICLDMSATSAGHIAGVRFHAHIMYTGPANITASTAGIVSDVWFTSGWQYDVVAGAGFTIGADGAGSKVYDLQFNDGYWAGGLIGAFKAFNIFTSSSGKCQGIDIKDNYFIQVWGDAILATNSSQINVSGNRFIDPNGGSLVSFGGCTGVVINDNVLQRLNGSGSVAYLVTNSGLSNYYSIRNNMGCGFATTGTVNDASPGAQRIVDGNF